ncbi:MAG: Fe-S cluster assembly protein SufD [Planctomycetaceae bacterium]|nr:Fe-S cluster assembly protein SufD [Planctomycetaceae bacterium]
MTSTTVKVTPPAPFAEEAFEAFLATRNEPDWFIQLRRQAYEVYLEKLAEELDPEEWRRVDIRTFRPENFHLATESVSEASFETLLQDRAEFAGQVTHVEGKTRHESLAPEYVEKGVIFGDLETVLNSHGELLQQHFMTRAVKPDADRISAWHAAFCTGGTVLYVPRNVELDCPLHSLIGLSDSGAADFSHTLVIVEENASATLLEETVSETEDQPGLHIGSVELLVSANARLRYVQLQNWNQKTWHLAHQCGRVGQNGSLQWTVAGLGASTAHIHQDVMLDGKGAEAQVNGVTFADRRQKISYYTKQAHNAESTRSDLLYKQVLRDKSKAIWRGMIRVEPEAQLTDGYQRCDALLLSPTCRNDSIPGLEIEADDVRCTHGATAGQVDEEQIFYAMSRGIPRFEAMHMIVEGFFQGVYDRIPVEVVRETLSQTVIRKLGIE